MTTTTRLCLRLRCLLVSAPLAALIGCAGGPDLSAGGVSRTAPPQDAEKTINNFFAFKLPGPQKNTHIGVGQAEPGDCALGGYGSSMRGWVVPVVYRTFSGELANRQTIQINEKQYYFWFHGNTIAGITRRAGLCPGLVSVFGDSETPAAAAARSVQAALEAPVRPAAVAETQATKAARPVRGKARPTPRAKPISSPSTTFR